MAKLSKKDHTKLTAKKVNKKGKKKLESKLSKKIVAQNLEKSSNDLTKSLNDLTSHINENIDKVKEEDEWNVEKLNISNNTTKQISLSDVSEKNSKYVSYSQITAGVNALLQLLQVKTKKNELFNEDEPIFLQIVSIKIPKTPRFNLRIPLPNSLVADTSDICLFVPDLHKGRKTDHEPTIQHYEDLLRSNGVKNIKGIIPMRQVKVEYDQFELRRRLLGQYDFFLADVRITKHLNKKLGKIFHLKRKTPTPIRLNAKDLQNEIKVGLSKVPLLIHGDGDTSIVQVGHVEQKIQKISENIMAAVQYLVHKYPGGWDNIRSLYIKAKNSLAIPIYISLKRKSEVKLPKVKPRRPKTYRTAEDELSTTFDKYVKVHPSGNVKVIKYEKSSIDANDSEDENDMEEELSDAEPEGTENDQLFQEIKFEDDNEDSNNRNSKKRQKDKSESESDSESNDDNLIDNAEEQYLQNYQEELLVQKKKQNKLKDKRNKPKQKKSKQK